MLRPRAVFLLVALSLGAAGAASADPSPADAARAAELKKKGDELVHASRYRDALPLYEESFSLVPDPALHYNRASALEKLEDFPAALEALEKFAETAPPALKARVPNLATHMQEVGAKVATLVVRCPVEGATITVRGKAAGTTPLASPLRTNPGEASVEVTAPGYAPFHKDVTLEGGATFAVDVALEKEQAPPAPKAAPAPETSEPPPESPPPSAGRGWKTAAFVSGGVGLASLGAGMVFFGLAMGDKGTVDAHCPDKACDAAGRGALSEAQAFATVSTVLVVVGAVGLAGGLAGLVLSPRGAPAQAALVIGPGGIGVGGTFR